MLTKLVSPGDKIDLNAVERLRGEKAEDKRIYYSQVHEVISSDRMEIIMPTEKTKLILLPVDSVYDMVIYTQGTIYQCFVRIVDRYKSNNLYILVVELTSNLRRYQRREFYRFSCAIEMAARTLADEEIKLLEGREKFKAIQGFPMKKGIIVDISGGGLRFITEETYDRDRLIYCTYQLLLNGENKECNMVGKVLSVKPVENREGVFEHRVKYVNIEVEKREEIIRYIFQEERKNRKKETGL